MTRGVANRVITARSHALRSMDLTLRAAVQSSGREMSELLHYFKVRESLQYGSPTGIGVKTQHRRSKGTALRAEVGLVQRAASSE